MSDVTILSYGATVRKVNRDDTVKRVSQRDACKKFTQPISGVFTMIRLPYRYEFTSTSKRNSVQMYEIVSYLVDRLNQFNDNGQNSCVDFYHVSYHQGINVVLNVRSTSAYKIWTDALTCLRKLASHTIIIGCNVNFMQNGRIVGDADNFICSGYCPPLKYFAFQQAVPDILCSPKPILEETVMELRNKTGAHNKESALPNPLTTKPAEDPEISPVLVHTKEGRPTKYEHGVNWKECKGVCSGCKSGDGPCTTPGCPYQSTPLSEAKPRRIRILNQPAELSESTTESVVNGVPVDSKTGIMKPPRYYSNIQIAERLDKAPDHGSPAKFRYAENSQKIVLKDPEDFVTCAYDAEGEGEIYTTSVCDPGRL